MGFSGFYQRGFGWQALIRIWVGGVSRYGEKGELGEWES